MAQCMWWHPVVTVFRRMSCNTEFLRMLRFITTTICVLQIAFLLCVKCCGLPPQQAVLAISFKYHIGRLLTFDIFVKLAFCLKMTWLLIVAKGPHYSWSHRYAISCQKPLDIVVAFSHNNLNITVVTLMKEPFDEILNCWSISVENKLHNFCTKWKMKITQCIIAARDRCSL